jgi:AcrR family transcriptional regulator
MSTMSPPTTTTKSTGKRQRVPASERRDALIESALHEFARGGLHGTPVDRIARRVGVAQPYVFALFGSKRELFLAAVQRCFEVLTDTFTRAAQNYDPETAGPDVDLLKAMGLAYRQLLSERRDYLMLQHHAFAACDDPVIRDRVRGLFAGLAVRVQELAGPDPEPIDEFFRYGMWLNAAAAMGVEDLSAASDWVRDEGHQSGGLRSG